MKLLVRPVTREAVMDCIEKVNGCQLWLIIWFGLLAVDICLLTSGTLAKFRISVFERVCIFRLFSYGKKGKNFLSSSSVLMMDDAKQR